MKRFDFMGTFTLIILHTTSSFNIVLFGGQISGSPPFMTCACLRTTGMFSVNQSAFDVNGVSYSMRELILTFHLKFV